MKTSYILAVLVIATGAFGWYWKQTHPDITSVTVVTAQKGDVEETVANTRAGTVNACRRAKLSPSIGGQISELPFKEGSYVNKGAILLTVWNEDILAEIAHIEKNIIVARDSAKARCLHANTAQRKADRARKLIASNTISREAYDDANTEAQVQLVECEVANDNIAVTQASLKVAKSQLERTILYAPFNGVIAKINGELNEYVTPSPPGIQTPTVVDLIEPGCFYITIPIDEVDAPKVKVGMPVRIYLDAWRGRTFDGEVSRIGTYVIDREKQARTVDIELAFIEKKDLDDLLVGYSADADIIIKTHKNVLRIPSDALLDDTHILLFNPETNLLEKKAIEKGLNNWSYTEIIDGLATGDQLATSPGAEGVKEGALVKVALEKQAND